MSFYKVTMKPFIEYLWGGCRLACIMGAGDVMAQRYRGVEHLDNIDWVRVSKFASIGLFFVGPAVTHWIKVINPIRSMQTTRPSKVLRQWISDQIYLAPAINAGIIATSSLVKIESPELIERHIAEKFTSLMKIHYIFWPPAQLFSSIFIQPNLQLMFIGTVAVAWFAYVSEFLRQRDHNHQQLRAQCSETPSLLRKEIFNCFFSS